MALPGNPTALAERASSSDAYGPIRWSLLSVLPSCSIWPVLTLYQ